MQKNIKLVLSYDGTSYCGFAKQPGRLTIEGWLEQAIKQVFGQKPKIIVAGRTDSKVHAQGQVVNFLVNKKLAAKNIVRALNANLPDDIRVQKAEYAAPGFNARFSARSREYQYLVYQGQDLPVFLQRFVFQSKGKISLQNIRRAIKVLTGEHDFSAFCVSGGSAKNKVRKMQEISVRIASIPGFLAAGKKDKILVFRFKANAFLYKMIRSIMGALLEVGQGKLLPKDLAAILAKGERTHRVVTLPAHGLSFTKVCY